MAKTSRFDRNCYKIDRNKHLFGNFSNESFGDNVSFSDDGYYLAVGCPTNSTGAQASVRAFEYDDVTMSWNQIGDPILGNWQDDFAYSSDMGNAGQTIIIGTPNSSDFEDNNVQVWVYGIDCAFGCSPFSLGRFSKFTVSQSLHPGL